MQRQEEYENRIQELTQKLKEVRLFNFNFLLI